MRAPLAPGALQAELEAKGVRYALASFVDLHGVCKAKAVPIDHLQAMASGSELFTGAALDGVPQDVSDDEVAAIPDLSSAVVLPWRPDTVWFASNLQLGSNPFEACSRNILSRVRDQAGAMGLRFNLGVETEFFVLRRGSDGQLVPASANDTLDKPCYDLRGLLDNLDWLGELVQAMNGLGWGVYSFDHEVSGASENWSGGDTKSGPPRGARHQAGPGEGKVAISGADGCGDGGADPSGRGGDAAAFGSRLGPAANRQGTGLLARDGAQVPAAGRLAALREALP